MAASFVVQDFLFHCCYEVTPVVLLKGLVVGKNFVGACICKKGHKMKLVESPITMHNDHVPLQTDVLAILKKTG